MPSRRLLICPGSASVTLLIAFQISFASAEPITYVPELHPTYREAVPAHRRLAHGGEAALCKSASKALGTALDFCIRLRRNMRREVTVVPEGDPGSRNDFFSAGKTYLLGEMRLYGSVNRSERLGISKIYRSSGYPIYVGLTAGDPTEGPPTLVTFVRDDLGAVRILDKEPTDYNFWTDAFVTDMTGDGLIDVAVAGIPGTSGGGGVSCFTVLADGQLVSTGTIHSAYGMVSLVDLNRDGIWEIETSEYISYEGGSGSYQFSCLSKYDPKIGEWRLVTDSYPISFRRQRRFYQALLPALRKNEAKGETHTPTSEIFRYKGTSYRLGSIMASDVERLLKSWDAFARDY